LEVLLAVHSGLDANTATKARELAEKVRQNPDYNQIKILEHFVLGVFDKLYTACKKPTETHTIKRGEWTIQVDHDLQVEINTNFNSAQWYTLKISYQSNDFIVNQTVYNSSNSKYLLDYIQYKVINNKFEKTKFLSDLIKLFAIPASPHDIVRQEDILKQFPLE